MVFCHFCVTALVKRTVQWNKGEAVFVSVTGKMLL